LTTCKDYDVLFLFFWALHVTFPHRYQISMKLCGSAGPLHRSQKNLLKEGHVRRMATMRSMVDHRLANQA
jgi:hypothetical protein